MEEAHLDQFVRARSQAEEVTPSAATFTNPLLPSGPDPWSPREGGTYYYIHSLGDRLEIRRMRDISKLAQAEEVTMWTPPKVGPNTRLLWTPELHRIEGKWPIFHSAATYPGGDRAAGRYWKGRSSWLTPRATCS